MKEDKVKDAYFNQGYNCCEAMLRTYAEDVGLTPEAATHMGTAFGAGMARQGMICGAVNGALMLLSAKYGRENSADTAAVGKTFKLSQEFMNEFKEKLGSLYCTKLSGASFARPGAYEAWAAAGGRTNCAEIVKEAAKIFEETAEVK